MTMGLSLTALALSLVATAAGQVLYKGFFAAAGKPRRWLWIAGAIACFLAAPVGSYLALLKLRIGMVYMSAALTHIMVVGASRALLREPLTRHHVIALVLIVSGVVLYGC